MLWVLIRIASLESPRGNSKEYVVGTHQNCLTEAILMSTHNICLTEAILMSTHNICFYEEISKIIP